MKKSLKHLLVLGATALGLIVAGSAAAADAKAALDQDKVCTTCHDASWDKPILSAYQQRHGVKADGRTPGCRTCHGLSDNHLKSPSNAPDTTFTKNSKNTAEERNAKCLGCHDGNKRTHWTGSQHEIRGLTCANCHDIMFDREGFPMLFPTEAWAKKCLAEGAGNSSHPGMIVQVHVMAEKVAEA